ncbi:MAG: hypothetical protein QXZ22_03480 [Sulfolobales archaeon]
MGEEEKAEMEERVEDVEEAPEALEEAPPDFVVDVSGLEIMIRISDLLYEASRSSEPTKYIEEISKLSSVSVTRERKKRERKVVKEKKAVKKKKKSS